MRVKKMSGKNRFFAGLLALVMIVGLLPASVFAEGSALLDAAIFCSDVHGSSSDLTSVMSGVKSSGVTYSSIGLVGDTCLTVANTESAVNSGLGYTPAVMFSYAASHDTENSSDIQTNWDYSGEVKNVSANYLVYTIRETDMQNYSDATTAAPAFTTWYNGLTDAQKALPIFIMSHRPLHARRSDNGGAQTWYNAISAAAKTSDIVFFWGHNHTNEDVDVDIPHYYVAKGGSLTLYTGTSSGSSSSSKSIELSDEEEIALAAAGVELYADSSSSSENVTINFTYMNAGYINANNQSPKRIGVATTVEIYADKMVFQDYNSSGKYTDSSYSHNVEVAREFAVTKTLSSIAVSGTTEYYVGDAFKAPTVKAVYSDNSEVDITSECTFSGYDMSTAGTQTVTVTWGEETTTYEITVTAVQLNSIAVTTQPTKVSYLTGEELDTTGMVVTGTYNNGTTAELTGWYVSSVDMTTAGGKTVTVNYAVDGITYKTTFTITVEEAPEALTLQKIEITTPPTQTEYLLSEELVLDGMVVTATFVNESNETVTQEIAYKPFSTSAVYGGYELDNFSMYVEKAHNLTVTYTYGEVTCTATTTINVWNNDFTDEDTSVKVHVTGDYGVTGISVAESTDANVATAIANVISGSTYEAYDISLVFDTGYSETNATKTVTLPIPSGVNNPVVYYVSDDGEAVENMKATKTEDGTDVVFTTTHFSTYVIGESTEITVPENETASGSITTGGTEEKTVYVLVSTPTAGNQYIIASSGSAGEGYALKENTTTGSSIDINAASTTITAPYIETSDTTIMWNYTSGKYLQSESGKYYLTGSESKNSFTLSFNTSSGVTWTAGTNAIYGAVTGGKDGNQTMNGYLRVDGGTWSMNRNSATVYFYEKQTIKVDTTTTVSGTCSIEGEDISAVVASDGSTTKDLTSTLILTPESGTAVTTDVSTTATYEIVTVDANGNTVDGDPNDIITKIENGVVYFSGNYGEALVKVSYDTNGDTDGGVVTDYITVAATAPYYTIQLHYAEMTKVTITEFADGVTYYTFNETTNTYHVATEYVEGTTYYTTPVVQGDEIKEVIALKGVEAGDTYSVWAVVSEVTSTGAADLGALGNALSWTVSDTSIATIDTTTGVITFTGTNYGTFTVTVAYEGADGKVITDTITISVTESLYVVPGDGTDDFPEYPNEGAVRFDKTATAVGNFSETGIALVELSMTGVPYSTGSEIDVVLMLDITGSMKDVTNSEYDSDDDEYYTRIYSTVAAAKAFARAIVINEDGTYNNNRIGIYSFNSGGQSGGGSGGSSTETIDSGSTYVLHELSGITDIDALDDEIDEFINDYASGGTPYAKALSAVQSTLAAAKTDGTGNDRQQFAVFMTDGCPTTYKGTANDFVSADNIQAMFTGTSYDTRDTDYEYEYYSTAMKADGVTVYTVGLGLNNENSAWSGNSITATHCYNAASILLNDISGPANEASQPDALGTTTLSKKNSYFFSVDDADAASQMGAVFSNIAQKIVEAAKDVVVEDKVGSNYSINFSLPENVTTDETDGLSEFYIQVVEYQLDSNKERTGDPYVKENFTFNADGTLKSHTVDGVTCTTCTSADPNHVVFTNGVVTAINGTYFTYLSDSTGEYLTWKEEKISTTELALQFFAHLDNSSDAVGTENEIPAGTYYTNEYATLTYTNYKGNQVQQEFPIPQMTWNGAQVSYVFYLVNEAGQPVNRAGRVVPFAEAVYVTDVYTYSVIWNSLEQSAGLEADYLAENLVPDAYALYDDDAEYFIHVYEDEEKDNLNNHFVIGGDVTDDYNTVTRSWTNANTTYVFNTKSDATKYNTVGTYINSDGTSTDVTTYLCKGDGTVTATIEQVTVADATAFAAGTYFVLNSSGKYVQAAAYDASATYYAITSASYTAAAGETQAKAADMESTSGATVLNGCLYYIDENNAVYTIVQKSNGTEVETGFDFHNTTVAFAVVWKPELVEDTVVVDYGLDVVIDVITNDSMAAGVVGVRTDAPSGVTVNSGNYAAAKATSVDVKIGDLKIGTATVENQKSVRFSFDKTNGMQFTEPVVFYYEADVNYYDSSNTLQTTSMYSKVTVIPATTIYYEDSFVTFTNSSSATGDSGTWTDVGSTGSGTQAQDRPGASKISAALDADNNYGYDSAYDSMSTYSLNGAKKVTVKSGVSGMASFGFYGTGFDVISLTDTTTGLIIVNVYDADNALVKSFTVDNYYGYAYQEGKWVEVSSNDPNALYQVPVMKVSGLDYGKYTVKIVASYQSLFDHTDSGSYGFYLDAIRIYDPTGNKDTTANTAYVADEEGWPTYEELRNLVIAAETFNSLSADDEISGVVFIDGATANGAGNTASVSDYTSYGPNNELYLAYGQAVAAKLNASTKTDYEVAGVQLAIKTVGDEGQVEVYGVDASGNKTTAVSETISTATDMYYDITALNGMTLVIKNAGDSDDAIVSITNIKVTYTEAQETEETAIALASVEEGEESYLLSVSNETATAALMSLRTVAVEEETTPDTETTPDVEVPEVEQPKPGKPERPGKQEQVEPEKPTKPGNDRNDKHNNKWNNRWFF